MCIYIYIHIERYIYTHNIYIYIYTYTYNYLGGLAVARRDRVCGHRCPIITTIMNYSLVLLLLIMIQIIVMIIAIIIIIIIGGGSKYRAQSRERVCYQCRRAQALPLERGRRWPRPCSPPGRPDSLSASGCYC